MKRSWKQSVVDEARKLFGGWLALDIMMKRSMGWAWRVKSLFGSLIKKQAVLDDGKRQIPQFSDWIPNVPYLEIVECYSGIEIYRGEGKFWVKGQAVSSLIKARILARAISNNSKWIIDGRQSRKLQRD